LGDYGLGCRLGVSWEPLGLSDTSRVPARLQDPVASRRSSRGRGNRPAARGTVQVGDRPRVVHHVL